MTKQVPLPTLVFTQVLVPEVHWTSAPATCFSMRAGPKNLLPYGDDMSAVLVDKVLV